MSLPCTAAWRAFAPVVFFLVGFFVSDYAPAQESRKVVEIEFQGDVDAVNPSEISENLKTRVGELYDEAKGNQDFHMIKEKFHVNAYIQPQDVPGGVKVVIYLEASRIQEFCFRGIDDSEAEKLRSILGLGEYALPDQDLLMSDAARIEDHFKEDGYYFIEVKPLLEPVENGYRAVFDVLKGEDVSVEAINFSGLTHLDDGDLRSVMTLGEPRFYNFKWLFPDKLRKDILNTDINELNRYLQEEGYLDARVSLDSLVFNDVYDEVEINILVQEGERYFIGNIDVEGCRAFFPEQLEELVTIERGDPYQKLRIKKDIRLIRRFYMDRGYIRAEVRDLDPVYDEESPQVDLIFRVDEGEQKTLRDVIISGNVSTQDKVIRREITLYPGDIIDWGEYQWSGQKLLGLQYFRDEKGAPALDMIFRPTDDPALEDLLIDVEEGGSGFFTFTVGLSTDTGIIGGINVDKHNFDISDPPSSLWAFPTEFFSNDAFHGAGQGLTLSAIPGTHQSTYRIFFREPYLFDTQPYPVSFSLDVFRRSNYFSDYKQRRVGVNPVLGKRWSKEFYTSLGFKSELINLNYDDDVFSVDDSFFEHGSNGLGQALTDPENHIFTDYDGKNGMRSLQGRVSYSDLDKPFEPTFGYMSSLDYEYSGGFMGSDIEISRAIASGRFFVPAIELDSGLKHVILFKGSFGWVEEHGSMNEVPIFERLFAGGVTGAFPLRGFRWRGVGPHIGGDTVGGKAALSFATEYSIPIVSEYNRLLDTEETMLKGILFFDGGSVAEDIHDSDLFHHIRTSYGAGIKLSLPVLGGIPISLFYGIPLKRYPDDERRSFNINISKFF